MINIAHVDRTAMRIVAISTTNPARASDREASCLNVTVKRLQDFEYGFRRATNTRLISVDHDRSL